MPQGKGPGMGGLNIKTIVGLAAGGFVGYHAGRKFGSGDLATWGGAAAGAALGYVVAKKV